MWLAVLLLALMASSSACPDSCECRGPAVECRGHAPSLAELDALPADYVEFKLRGLEEEALAAYVGAAPSSSFLRRLRSVEVTNCTRPIDLRYLKWDVHRENERSVLALPNVRALNVTHNNLNDSPGRRATGAAADIGKQPGAFDSERNQDAVDSAEAEHTSQLVWLCLARNNLDYIAPGNFRYLGALEYLDLSNNALETLERSFDELRSLQRLNLAGNKLVHVQAKWFQNLAKLVELDISRNKLTFISADTLQPLASLSVLRLAENPLIKRDLSLILGTGRRLETVDASMIGLVRVPAALTRSVRTLQLAGNQLTSINSGDLDSYPLLRVLDLSNNRLMIIEEDALGRLDGLEELYLSGNILPSIPKSLPSGLKIFDLSQNAISALRVNDLQGLYLLKELNLSGNVISVIEGGSFRQLPALEKLDISDNPIKKLPSDTLSGPTNLMTLRMSGLRSLETEKNQNQDTSFPILTLERLGTLDVSRSPALAAQLMADNAALSACKSLQELDLSYTNVGTMRSDLAYVLPQLWKLNLNGNAWNCGTPQIWMRDWTALHSQKLKFSRARCTSSSDYRGETLEEEPVMSSGNTDVKLSVPTVAVTTTPRTRDSTTVRGTVKIPAFAEKSGLKATKSPAVITKIHKTIENRLSSTEGKSKISFSPTMQTITVSESLQNIESLPTKRILEESKSEILFASHYLPEKSVTSLSSKRELPYSSTPSDFEEFTTKMSSHETAKPTHNAISINLMEKNQEKIVHPTESSSERVSSTTNDNKEVIKDLFSSTSTESSTDTVPLTTNDNKKQLKEHFTSSPLLSDTSPVKNVSSTESPTSTKVDVSTTAQIMPINRGSARLIKGDRAVINNASPVKNIASTESPASTEVDVSTTAKLTPTNREAVRSTKEEIIPINNTSPVITVASTESPARTEADVTTTVQITPINRVAVHPIKAERPVMNKGATSKADAILSDKKFAELMSSKMMMANDEPRVNSEPSGFAEELNGQATESGARTSESLTTGAHPGMLVLLGAAIGAAAALTVVLSRRATVKRRDRQYQRHENIEVHALTPTTELW